MAWHGPSEHALMGQWGTLTPFITGPTGSVHTRKAMAVITTSRMRSAPSVAGVICRGTTM